jgi:hypothetical protein
MQRIMKREIKDTIANKIKIKELSPKLDKVSTIVEDLERVKHLDRCRRLIAYNTLKQW